ncbi:hypothetical protein [Flexibacterium corallicola]|uniref:hypothetical protein n=1 Tax=Flexibacterium corallicola TaxID=3037259 RepID=UPI00286F0FAA|nr:hypothetical protein [Pseudovibrio sp. M1P-2-3]
MQVDIPRLIEEQITKRGSIQAVADAMGVSRTSVSLYRSDKLAENGGRVDRFEAIAMARFYDQVLCPHLKTGLSKEECAKHATRSVPQSDPDALRHWATCQNCPLKMAEPAGQGLSC